MNKNEAAMMIAIHKSGMAGHRHPNTGSRGAQYQAQMRQMRLMNRGLITVDAGGVCRLTVEGLMWMQAANLLHQPL